MIQLLCGNKLSQVKNQVIKSIGNNRLDLFCDNIIVVPDRYSLIVEKSVFEQLNIYSTFNIHVMGINALAKKLIEASGLNCVFVDSLTQDFILYRAIQNTKSKFVCFSKSISMGLVEKIKNAISLFMSNDICAEKILESLGVYSQSMQKKLTDIANILQEYTRLLDGRLDASGVLSTFSSLISNTKEYASTNFYFCGFDSFTKQGYEIIKKICKVAKNTTIGIIVPSNNKNRYIFDNEMLSVFESYFKQNNMEYNLQFFAPSLNENQKIIFDNVYGYKLKDLGLKADVAELATNLEEVEFVAKNIAKMVKNGKKYANFCVSTQKSYFDIIKKTFSKYGICCFIDEQKLLKDTPLFVFVNCCLQLCVFGYEKDNLVTFINNHFVQLDKEIKNDIENYILENNIEYKKIQKLCEQFNIDKINNLIAFCDNIKPSQNFEYYICKVQELFDAFGIKQSLQTLCEKFIEDNQLELEKIYIQIYDKIQDLNQKLVETLGKEEISLLDFIDLYMTSFGQISISSVPLAIDQVFVGDCAKSFFESTEYMFVVGANQDMPTQIKDTGLILDKDIETISDAIKISPTAKIINKRNKFKLFDSLSECENLMVTYCIADETGKKLPSNFACDILTLNGNKKITREDFDNDILFNNPNILVAKQNVCATKNGETIKTALKVLGQENDVNFLNRDFVESGSMMLKNDKTKISQIESYYSCPFKHFATYGLKLVERKEGQIKANDLGNFLHEFCEMFVNKNKSVLGKMTDKQIDENCEKIVENLKNKPNFAVFCDEDNDILLKLLKNEVLRIANFINYEQSVSDFKIFKTEYKFDDDNLKVCVFDKDYTIVGIVDRLDVCDNYFRIVDYKTGSLASSNSSLSNLYNGTKIQVFVYLKAMENVFKSNAFGAFYLPISNAYSDEKVDDYRMHGYFIDNMDLVKRADKSLGEENLKSKLFEVTLTKDLSGFSKSKNVTKEELLSMTNYAVKAVEVAIKEIVDGNTKVSPVDGVCQFCEYKYICGKTDDLSYRTKKSRISPSDFLGVKHEWV